MHSELSAIYIVGFLFLVRHQHSNWLNFKFEIPDFVCIKVKNCIIFFHQRNAVVNTVFTAECLTSRGTESCMATERNLQT
jgi:hypothetical protein